IRIAGGIGVTPILCMAQTLYAHGEDFEFHYFANSNQELVFHELIAGGDWYDRVSFHLGVLPPLLNDVLDNIVRGPKENDTIYLCGPAPFMDAVKASAQNMDWPSSAVVMERFSISDADLPAPDEDGEGFTVRLAKQETDLVVPPDKTIVEVIREAGFEIQTNCEQGICGTCLSTVLEG